MGTLTKPNATIQQTPLDLVVMGSRAEGYVLAYAFARPGEWPRIEFVLDASATDETPLVFPSLHAARDAVRASKERAL